MLVFALKQGLPCLSLRALLDSFAVTLLVSAEKCLVFNNVFVALPEHLVQ